MQRPVFLTVQTIQIIVLGLIAFGMGAATGVIMGRIMSKATGGKVNPLIGAAGVSAVPMAAGVCQTVGQEANPSNSLLRNSLLCPELFRLLPELIENLQ